LTTLMSDLIADTRRMAYGSQPEALNLVASAYTAGATSLVLTMDVTGITPGTVISSGLNVWYVRGVTASTKTLTVIPGYANSPQGNCSVGDFVIIRPKVTNWDLFNMLNAEILRLSSPSVGLYRLGTWTDTVNIVNQVYDLPANTSVRRVVRVRFSVPGLTDVWSDLNPGMWRFDPGHDTVQLTRDIPGSSTVQFVYEGGFTAATALSTNTVTTCGLTANMLDIPVLGAVSKLLLTTESRRNQVQSQGDTRRAGEVLQGGNSSTARYFERQWQVRVDEECARLLNSLPVYRGTP
jgi:hypothetical protein